MTVDVAEDMEAIYTQIGARIRMSRDFAPLTQAELADLVGLSRASIANIETGRQRIMIHQLGVFALVLGVPLTAFLDVGQWKQIAKLMDGARP